MNRNQRVALAKKDLTVKELRHQLDRHPNHVTGVLAGRYKSFELRKKISEILGKSEDYLWPNESD